MKKIIAGNWKFNKELRDKDKAREFIEKLEEEIAGVDNVEVKVFPHNFVLPYLAGRTKKVKLGAQDIHWEEDGSFTSAQFSARDIVGLGIKETLIGHSETRFYFGVNEKRVALKLNAALREGILPTICIGEDIKEKEEGRTKEVLEKQIREGILSAFAKASADKPSFAKASEDKPSFAKATEDKPSFALRASADKPASAKASADKPAFNVDVRRQHFLIGYEPVYAIAGFAKMRGKEPQSAKIEDIEFAHRIIREIFSQNGYPEVKILYGGSSKPENAKELLSQPFIDGLLIGTASWNLSSFLKIIETADEIG